MRQNSQILKRRCGRKCLEVTSAVDTRATLEGYSIAEKGVEELLGQVRSLLSESKCYLKMLRWCGGRW